jgi:hypothetical protein
MARTASSPRLSIGKYIGAPKSVSTSPTGESDLTARVEKLETDVADLETSKQDNMSATGGYIYIEDNDILLDLEALQAAMESGLKTDRKIVFNPDDTGLQWKYDGDSEWNPNYVVEWAYIAEKLDIAGINTKISNVISSLNNKLDKSYDLTENPAAGGMALVVNKETGAIEPTGKFVNAEWSGEESKNKILVTDETGTVKLSNNEMVSPDDLGNLAFLDESDLGALAWEDTVTTDFIADKAVTRAKMADQIAEIMDWINWWKTNVPNGVGMDENGNIVRPGAGSDDGYQYVLSMDKYGNAQWFRVITPENAEELDTETP